MTQTLVAIGTRKGLWLARSTDRDTWSLDGPHFLMREVPSIGIDTRSWATATARGGALRALGPDDHAQ